MAKITNGTRQKENESILKHLIAIEKIIGKKCKRCRESGYPYSCMGCHLDDITRNIERSKTSIEDYMQKIQYKED